MMACKAIVLRPLMIENISSQGVGSFGAKL